MEDHRLLELHDAPGQKPMVTKPSELMTTLVLHARKTMKMMSMGRRGFNVWSASSGIMRSAKDFDHNGRTSYASLAPIKILIRKLSKM